MSSHPCRAAISPEEMEMIQSVLNHLGPSAIMLFGLRRLIAVLTIKVI